MTDDLGERGAIVGASGQRPQARTLLLLLALPAAWLARALAFAFPDTIEAVYSRGLYPPLARGLGSIAGLMNVSLAEALVPPAGLAMLALLVATWRRTPGGRTHKLTALLLAGWGVAGATAWLFLFAWGFHYARPPLEARLGLDTAAIEAREVAHLGAALGARASTLRLELGIPDDHAPAPLPANLDFTELDRQLEIGLRALDLPGDRLGASPVPAKPLLSSEWFARLGISGIFIPFTVEPSVNVRVPAPQLPVVIAHEKAHQRGITDEGEANLVGILAALRAEHPYIRYAAHLDAAAALLGAAGRYLDEEERAAGWRSLGPGALADLRAIREFWLGYRGTASEVATRMNDAYLRSNRVEGGVESYGRVVRLLVGAQRAGRLQGASATAARAPDEPLDVAARTDGSWRRRAAQESR